jgi:hypothetical protein
MGPREPISDGAPECCTEARFCSTLPARPAASAPVAGAVVDDDRILMIDFFRDLWDFLRTRKKIWMLPIIVLMVVLGGLIIVSQQSVLGSFIYTLF